MSFIVFIIPEAVFILTYRYFKYSTRWHVISGTNLSLIPYTVSQHVISGTNLSLIPYTVSQHVFLTYTSL